MRRRLSTVLLPAAALLAVASLSACSAADDNDVAARVNDSELSNDELADLVTIVGTPDPATGTVDPTQGENVRGAIQLWVQVEVIGAGLEAGERRSHKPSPTRRAPSSRANSRTSKTCRIRPSTRS